MHKGYIQIALTEIQLVIGVFLYKLILFIHFLTLAVHPGESVKHLASEIKRRKPRNIGESVS